MRKAFLAFCLFFTCFFPIFAQGNHPLVLRGEVYVDIEPIYAGHIDSEYPLDMNTAGRRALDEASMLFSAMIYGWSFNYEVGERARQIEEILELEPIGSIQFGDPALRVTDTNYRNSRLHVWMDYHLDNSQQRRMQIWRSGSYRNAQAVGYAPSYIEEFPGWLAVKKIALDDAARAALRSMLRGSERNRPKEAHGLISLAGFPRYYIESGRWAVSARFRVQVTEIVPFAVH